MKLKTLLMRLDLLSSSWAGVWPCVCGFFAIVYHLPFWRTSVMNQHLCEGSFKGNSRIHLYSSFFFLPIILIVDGCGACDHENCKF